MAHSKEGKAKAVAEEEKEGKKTEEEEKAKEAKKSTRKRKTAHRTLPREDSSIWRAVFAFVVISGLMYSVSLGWNAYKRSQSELIVTNSEHQSWFAAYVDVTSTPMYDFEDLRSTTTPDVVLAFIVASGADSCVPTWGTYYTMDKAEEMLNLDRRVELLQQQGGRVAISFGGNINTELAMACSDPDQLHDAYQSVIERYNVETMDLDIEGKSIDDIESIKHRATVVSQLQKEYRDAGKRLDVWLTVPVTPAGLSQAEINLVDMMLANGVDVAGVNIMTMDYGPAKDPDQTMSEAAEQSLAETYRQLSTSYEQVNTDFSGESLWRKIGVTPMIGQNDVRDEVFTLDDAKSLSSFVSYQGVGRVSMWSANRDKPCGENYTDVKVVSGSCSGVDAEKRFFSRVLSNTFDGNLP